MLISVNKYPGDESPFTARHPSQRLKRCATQSLPYPTFRNSAESGGSVSFSE
jgi:hypothetical protein